MSYPRCLHAHASHIAVAQIHAFADLAQVQRHKAEGAQRADIGVEPAISVEQPHSDDEQFQEFHPAVPFSWGGMDACGGAGYTAARPAVCLLGSTSEDSRQRSSGGSPAGRIIEFEPGPTRPMAATTAQSSGQRRWRGKHQRQSRGRAWDNVEGRCCAVCHEPSHNELGA